MNASRFRLLRVALLANATFSTVSGLTMALAPAETAELLGGLPGGEVQLIGVALLLFAAAVFAVGIRPSPERRLALAISVADLGWVGLTFGLALALPFTAAGLFAIAAVNAFVGGFAVAQLAGIARSYRAEDGRYEVCVSVPVSAPPARFFDALADLPAIAQHSRDLAYSILRNGAPAEAGAVRECGNERGDKWAERVTRLDRKARALDVTFLADEPDFPFPFREMVGGWTVEADRGGALVRVWWRVRPTRPWLAPVILPLMAAQARRDMEPVVRSLAGETGPVGDGPGRAAFC